MDGRLGHHGHITLQEVANFIKRKTHKEFGVKEFVTVFKLKALWPPLFQDWQNKKAVRGLASFNMCPM